MAAKTLLARIEALERKLLAQQAPPHDFELELVSANEGGLGDTVAFALITAGPIRFFDVDHVEVDASSIIVR